MFERAPPLTLSASPDAPAASAFSLTEELLPDRLMVFATEFLRPTNAASRCICWIADFGALWSANAEAAPAHKVIAANVDVSFIFVLRCKLTT